MIGSLVINRRRNFYIWEKERTWELENQVNGSSPYCLLTATDRPSQYQPCPPEGHIVCGRFIQNPDSSRWAHHIHSRVMQKLPFLVEMFYWAINYLFYSITKATSQWLSPASIGVVQVAQDHGISIMNFEHRSIFRFIFAIEEVEIQAFFVNNHPAVMTFFNRVYSLIHIPGSVL